MMTKTGTKYTVQINRNTHQSINLNWCALREFSSESEAVNLVELCRKRILFDGTVPYARVRLLKTTTTEVFV